MDSSSTTARPTNSFLLFNVGNTVTQIAAAPLQAGGFRSRLATADLLAGALPTALPAKPPRRWLVACVVPAAADSLRQAARQAGAELAWIAPHLLAAIPVDCSRVDMSTVGADRLANLAAAAALLPLPAIVVDCGTAITTEVVAAGPAFLGGAIAPGRQMARRALHAFTGQLPLLEMATTRPDPIGCQTVDAMRAGIDLGVLGAVDMLVRATIRQAGFEDCTVVATGGDADFFVGHLPTLLQPAPADFTLLGLQHLATGLSVAPSKACSRTAWT